MVRAVVRRTEWLGETESRHEGPKVRVYVGDLFMCSCVNPSARACGRRGCGAPLTPQPKMTLPGFLSHQPVLGMVSSRMINGDVFALNPTSKTRHAVTPNKYVCGAMHVQISDLDTSHKKVEATAYNGIDNKMLAAL